MRMAWKHTLVAENKHWTVSKLQQPQDVFVEGLLRREGMK